ncbi:TfoX/Sxy family protein [Roseobacter sp. YSTF-M11]|uniref:TfoX/Sxy family protein n=1 Tax=Roseobacter insulae TaxID=2859783 RepID=A0A9X1K3W6_9RHOB|nr:TfoX/Sxy family protein [Roseobacter insulae]MBW4709092.1 TfoX/Sxy family protein [Roseobacter insulae]
MPYDEELTTRMRRALEAHVGISEKRMMGGNCFFLNGNMISGARRDKHGVRRFMFRVGKDHEAQALSDPHAQPVIHGTRKLGGFILVANDDCDTETLKKWLSICLEHAAAMPPKS